MQQTNKHSRQTNTTNKQSFTWLQALFHPRHRASRVLPPPGAGSKTPKLENLTLVRCQPPAVNFTPHTSWAPQNCHIFRFRLEYFIISQGGNGFYFYIWYYLPPVLLSCSFPPHQFGFEAEVGLIRQKGNWKFFLQILRQPVLFPCPHCVCQW